MPTVNSPHVSVGLAAAETSGSTHVVTVDQIEDWLAAEVSSDASKDP